MRTYQLDEGRLWVRLISRQAFRQYMEYRNETNRSLADKTKGVAKRGIISHLRSGERNTCTPRVARAIEEALNAPPGSLFMAELPTAQRASARRERVPA